MSSQAEVDGLIGKLGEKGVEAYLRSWRSGKVVVLNNNDSGLKTELERVDCVERVIPVNHPFQLASRAFERENTVVDVGGVRVGGRDVTVIAGPCAIEGEQQLLDVATSVKKVGACMLRGGAFKPRSSPYSFQGLGVEGLKILERVGRRVGLPTVTEVMSPGDVGLVAKYADMLQVGARNMQNFSLLKEVGKAEKPVLLKRGMSATIEELLLSAEYVLQEGNSQVILCERGIRTFERASRNTLDLTAIPVCKELSHLPIIVDPSHATGYRRLVPPLARAAVAAGADGLIMEVHTCPEKALCDGPQSITPDDLGQLMRELPQIARALGRGVLEVGG